MSVLPELLNTLGKEIQDVDEEVFDIFSHSRSSQDLGMVNGKAGELEIAIAGRDFTIKQSPGVLQSNREGGTTGAALWRICVTVAEWLGAIDNALFQHSLFNNESVIVELGSGISGLIPLTLSPRVKKVIATDQQYALKLLNENIEANVPKLKPSKGHVKQTVSNIETHALDWETTDAASFMHSIDLTAGVDAIVVCDCIFNYALIGPLVETCANICELRRSNSWNADPAPRPTICIVAQQLRQPDVFEQWLQAFQKAFCVWRVPDNMLSQDLKEGSGYVVHIGLLR